MRYQSKEQAFLEQQKCGMFPTKIYEVEVDEVTLFYTPQHADAYEFKIEGEGTYKIIRTHLRK